MTEEDIVINKIFIYIYMCVCVCVCVCVYSSVRTLLEPDNGPFRPKRVVCLELGKLYSFVLRLTVYLFYPL